MYQCYRHRTGTVFVVVTHVTACTVANRTRRTFRAPDLRMQMN